MNFFNESRLCLQIVYGVLLLLCVYVYVCERLQPGDGVGVWAISEKFIGDRHECFPAVTLTNNNNKNF
jgi:hypothetical protein